MPDSTAADKILKKAVKSNNLAMAHLHFSMDSDKPKGWLAKACNYDYPK